MLQKRLYEEFIYSKKGTKPYCVWSSILQGRYLLLRGLWWKFGNIRKVVQKYQWIPGVKRFKSIIRCPVNYTEVRVGGANTNGLHILFNQEELIAIKLFPSYEQTKVSQVFCLCWLNFRALLRFHQCLKRRKAMRKPRGI